MVSFAILILCLAPFLAHAAGRVVAKRLSAQPGRIREWMPSIPNNTVTDASAEKRWQKRGTLVEARLLKRLEDGVEGVSAEGLAAELGEDVSVVAAVLAHMREEVDCRLRVTRGGQLLHDFKASDIATLRQNKRRSWPARAAIFVLSVFANIGAAWPMVLSMVVAGGALLGMAAAPDPLIVGGAGILGVFAIFGFNAIAGWFIHAIMTPWMSAPRLGSTESAEDGDMLQDEQAREYLEVGSTGDLGGWVPVPGSSGDGCAALDFDGDSAEGCMVAIVAAILVGIVVALTFAIGVWLRGLWRAVKRLGVPDLILSPTTWIRGSHPVDTVERFIPTNDLVIRVTRALRRVSNRVHPEDGGMVQRVMGLAAENNGRVSALEIGLAEGLDLNEANTVGAELTTFLDGRIDVSDDGELDFVFRPEVLKARFSPPNEDRNAEYVRLDQGSIKRRAAQKEKNVPVNIPGISYGHLVGTDRLVAGTLMMTICAMVVVHVYPDAAVYLEMGVDFLFPLMTLGAFALSGMARYAAASMAKLGVFRDIRRAAFYRIDRALRAGHSSVDLEKLATELTRVFKPAFKGLAREDVLKELEAVAIDLDLDLASNSAGKSVFEVKTLGRRMGDLRTWRNKQVVFDFGAIVDNADEVVFDSKIEHDA